jgi:hypothetical protein
MQYIDVVWLHECGEDPVRITSEMDDERYEVRKLEFFRDGAVCFASATLVMGDTMLSAVPVPPLEEINSDPQFQGVSMSASEFEELWVRHAL